MARAGMQPMPNGGLPYLRRTSFLKVFSRLNNMVELRIPADFDALYSPRLPLECRLVRPNGIGWTLQLFRLGSGSRFRDGWPEFVHDNLLKHGDFLTSTLADVGIFHVKRYDVRTGVPPLTDSEDIGDVPDEEYLVDDVDTTDGYEPSDCDMDSTDDSSYEDDNDALDLDGRPTFDVAITTFHFTRTFEIPFGFWRRHILMGALQAPVYFLTTENTWILSLMHKDSKIWVKNGWKQFRHDNGLVVGDRLHFTLVNPLEVTFYVWVEKA
ncbi:B3 domain-containing protein REM20-like [Salvia splendens]|nr:B3 domain-containing protein REM20-like [Salvia splendens]